MEREGGRRESRKMRERGKKNRNKNKSGMKGEKEGGETPMTALSDPLDPVLDFVAMEKNKMVGEKRGTCQAHAKSVTMKTLY